jgi:hypothetical protein
MRYRVWTEQEDGKLLKLRAAGRSLISISNTFKRTVSAVDGHLAKLQARVSLQMDNSPRQPTDQVGQ